MAPVEKSVLPYGFYQAQPNMVQQAIKQYPYLQKGNVGFLYTPNTEEKRQMEYWPPGEEGSSEEPRPAAFPLQSPGIQVFSPQATPLDLL